MELQRSQQQGATSINEKQSEYEQRLKTELQAQESRLAQQHGAAIAELKHAHDQRVASINAEVSAQLSKLTLDLRESAKQREGLACRLTQAQDGHAKELREREESFAHEREALRMAQAQAELAMRQKHDSEVAELQHALQLAKSQLISAASDREAALVQDHQQAIRALQLDQDRALQAQREGLDKQHMHELELLRAELARVSESAVLSARNELSTRHSQLISEMNAAQERQLIGLKAQYDAKIDLDRIKIEELIKEARTTHERLHEREVLLAKLQPLSIQLAAELERAKGEINSLGQEILGVRRECMDTITRHEEQSADQYRKQTETLMTGYQTQINRINAETEKRIAMMQQQLKVIEDELVASEARYQHRPSREEDIARIAQLEELAARQTEQIT